MTSKAYVFVDGLEDEPVICGVVTLNTHRGIGEFRYGKSYLERDDAFPLDPINLPLSDALYTTTEHHGQFGVLSDAGPDSWGKKVILSLHNTKPSNALEYLLVGAGMGVGALTFSLSRTASKPKHNKNNVGDMPMLLKAKDAILNDEAIPAEAKKAFECGSSMGGARPKTTVTDKGKTYLAKFNRADDLFNQVKVEHASMCMLKESGCRVAPTRVLATTNGDVLLVERFDRASEKITDSIKPNHHFISANALIDMSRVNDRALTQQYSYGYLAEFLLRHSAEPEDAIELYRRMVFNVLIGNTDDHTRNHACLYSFAHKHWRLSPAYDVLPINNSRQHSLGIGEQGRLGSEENLLSQSTRFGLKAFKAQKILNQIKELVAEWPTYFKQHGVGDGDLERLKAVIPESVI
ncbi:type II toxin-antitoxin system HipA family toxin [Paraneptunicella aestuarii]|uniref:type II toxin-antitoxin system HipA family toxin n=1 Tax=Paraneptunicella aestuarii TaxID=2831148 RepID=UPI001E3DEA7B|nr:type II toxin-antitoxin system HipA family toxin [Paraneptunicella aestuarii]UAA38772.1 type II toxin-antitoxin system HipA family toxin [Paraneptunicella aestuarii]